MTKLIKILFVVLLLSGIVYLWHPFLNHYEKGVRKFIGNRGSTKSEYEKEKIHDIKDSEDQSDYRQATNCLYKKLSVFGCFEVIPSFPWHPSTFCPEMGFPGWAHTMGLGHGHVIVCCKGHEEMKEYGWGSDKEQKSSDRGGDTTQIKQKILEYVWMEEFGSEYGQPTYDPAEDKLVFRNPQGAIHGYAAVQITGIGDPDGDYLVEASVSSHDIDRDGNNGPFPWGIVEYTPPGIFKRENWGIEEASIAWVRKNFPGMQYYSPLPLSFADNKIRITLNVFFSDDPHCCPLYVVTDTYVISTSNASKLIDRKVEERIEKNGHIDYKTLQ